MDRYNLSVYIEPMKTGAEYALMLKRLTEHRLALISFVHSGPGGNHVIVLQGTADDLVRWLNEDYYDGETNYTFPDACRSHGITLASKER